MNHLAKIRRQQEAKERQTQREKRTVVEQITLIITGRPGESKKELSRLNTLLIKQKSNERKQNEK